MSKDACLGPSCDGKVVGAAGLCHAHSEFLRRHPGAELKPVLRRSDVRGRFFAKVRTLSGGPNGDCWVWSGATDGGGRYGSFQYDGKVRRAHRVSWEWKNGPVPEGLVLDHLCRNTLCVNPDHLEPVTQRENIMRGEAIQAKNARKTHCCNGHEFTEENTRLSKAGGRACRTCERNRHSRFRGPSERRAA